MRKFSDFISRRQLHRLEIYDLVYAAIEVEHQIAFTLPAPSAHVIGFALNRKRGDFSERDRNVLDAIRPFVVQAYIDAAARARARAAVAALECASDSAAQAVIVLERGGRIELATDLARHWLGALNRAGAPIRLPEPLLAWSAAQRRRAREGPSRVRPLELELSERTIAKHLEHIYAKLDVGNRTAAVARAREASTHSGHN